MAALVLLALFSAGCGSKSTTVPPPDFAARQTTSTQDKPSPRAYDEIRADHLGLEDGLSDETVSAVFQDSQGFMWFGTYDGLNRYDGYQFRVFRHEADDPHTLSGNVISGLLEGRDGRLWIATQGDGLSVFDPATESFTSYHHDENDANSLAADFIQEIREDEAGNFWLGTLNGLNKLEPETGTFHHFRNDFDPPEVTFGSNLIEDLTIGADGLIWLATYNGLLTFDPISERFSRIEIDPQLPERTAVGSLAFDDQGTLWVGTTGGLYWLEPDTLEAIPYSTDPELPAGIIPGLAHAIHQDPAGNVWMATGEGLLRWDKTRGRFFRQVLDSDDPDSQTAVLSLFTDASDILWVGTNVGGLYRLDPWRHKFRQVNAQTEPFIPGLSSSEVLALAEDQRGYLWIGTDAGLDRWDRQSQTWWHWAAAEGSSETSVDYVYAMYIDQDDTIWLATDKGLTRFDPLVGRAIAHLPFATETAEDMKQLLISDFHQDTDGNLWLAMGYDGLIRVNPETYARTHFRYTTDAEAAETQPANMLWSIIEDRDVSGRFWLGTRDGLARFEDGVYTFFRHDPDDPGTIISNDVHGLYQDESGLIWLGTSAGLNQFDPLRGLARRFDEEWDLARNAVFNVLPDDDGDLWLTTNTGLSRFDPRTESFLSYDSGDGLQGSGFNNGAVLKSATGELFFGGSDGFNYFQPDEIPQHAFIPPVVISGLSILNRPVAVEPDSVLQQPIEQTHLLKLGPDDNVFTFELATLHYADPEKNQYAYFLEGFDEDWNYIGTRRYATYTNLPPGEYTFRVIGSNSDGVWNQTGTAVQIIIHPPWWGTTWFRASVVLVILALGALGYQWRVRSIRARSRELGLEVAERTRELSALYTITAFVSGSLDLEDTLTAALDNTLEVMDCQVGGIYLLEGTDRTLTLVTHRNLSQACLGEAAKLALTGSFLEPAMASRRPFLVRDLSKRADSFSSALFGQGLDWMVTIPLVSRGIVLGALFMSSPGAHRFTERNLELLGSIGNQIGIAVENARLFSAERMRAEQLALISQVSQRITSILDIDQVLEQIVNMVQQTFGYYHVAIGLVEGSDVVYRVGAGSLWNDPEFDFWPPRLKVGEEGLSGWVAGTGQPLLVPDVRQEPRYVWMRRSKTQSELTLPIRAKDVVIGVLDLQSDRLNDFDEIDLVVMELLARQAGIAIENARLYEQAQQMAVIEERNRLARDLHDSVTQSIYSLTLLAEAGQRMIDSGDKAQIRQNQGRLGTIAQQALQEMRLLVYELRPHDLKKAGLVPALEQRLEVVERRAGVEARLNVNEDLALSERAEEALYRIAHEALNNALKHAGATAVTVSIDAQPGLVTLEVTDNGRGFEASLASHQGGLGLVSMRERAAGLKARLHIDSAPGEGTTVCVQLPTPMQAKAGTAEPEEVMNETKDRVI